MSSNRPNRHKRLIQTMAAKSFVSMAKREVQIEPLDPPQKSVVIVSQRLSDLTCPIPHHTQGNGRSRL